MANLIQLRRDIAANWADINPKLEQGEVGFELDTGRIKIGDGIQLWNTLPYFSASQLPPSNIGYLRNDGAGNISWVPLNLFSGNYDDLTNKPTIPIDTSDLTDNGQRLLPVGSNFGFDFGTISNKEINSKLEWILHSFDYDNGTINSPANIDHDAGTLI
jgi:hypothetical protein